MGCGEVLALLREREAAYRREAERLRGEAERIAGLLAVCEQELARVATACQVVGEVPVVHGAAGSGRGRIPAPRAEMSGTVGSQATEGTGEFTRRMLEVLASNGNGAGQRQRIR